MLLVSAISCHKKANEAVPVAPGCQLLTAKDSINGKVFYTYNSENKLAQISHYDTTGTKLATYTICGYDSEGRITKISLYSPTNLIAYTTYVYNTDNTLAADTSYGVTTANTSNLVCTAYSIYVYDNLNRVYQIDNYVNSSLVAPPLFTYVGYSSFIYDSKGNVLQAATPTINNVQGSVVNYTYDNNPRFISDADKVYNIPLSLSPNNVTSTSIINYNNSNVKKTTYTYNANKYPLIAVTVATDSSSGYKYSYSDTTTYTYNCN